ncbi:MAG: hypothetical protein CVV44_17455 [Spirochaetae bacterium HGW-Spirochaetae-1]|nr:MAG: hypothetical protein CVV44_17455 [Spirochaetae bacterium HGW-Spirochaetae-1]
MSSGNLSIQLKKLGDESYITIKKKFKENKPLTFARLTQTGYSALEEYLDEMESIIKSIRVRKQNSSEI